MGAQVEIEEIYRQESGRIIATLIRLLGDFDLAEEVTQEAFAVAIEQWPRQGVPANPRAWLVSTARNKAVDLIRRRSRFAKKQDELQRLARAREHLAASAVLSVALSPEDEQEDAMLSDDRLRLIYLLPPRSPQGVSSGTYSANPVWLVYRGNCQSFSVAGAHHGATTGASKN